MIDIFHAILYPFRYLDNKVFVSLANGDITVYVRDHSTYCDTLLQQCFCCDL